MLQEAHRALRSTGVTGRKMVIRLIENRGFESLQGRGGLAIPLFAFGVGERFRTILVIGRPFYAEHPRDHIGAGDRPRIALRSHGPQR